MQLQTEDNESGFTIIETLIVLGVAGLMLMLIFLAIPTLQRSGQNNQRNQDVQTILAAMSQYALNNSGNFPAPNVDYLNNARLTFYEAGAISTVALNSGQDVDNTSTLDTVIIHNRQKCDPNNLGKSTPRGAGFNDVVALFSIETGNGRAERCKEM